MFDPTVLNENLVDGKYTQLVPLGQSLVQQHNDRVVNQKFLYPPLTCPAYQGLLLWVWLKLIAIFARWMHHFQTHNYD